MAFKPHKLNQRVLEDLKKRSYLGIIFYLIILYIVFYSGGYNMHYPQFTNWMIGSMSGICLFRLLHLPIAKRMEPRFIKTNNVLFILSVVITAVIWGAGFAVFMVQGGLADATLLMVMCTIGLSSGAAVAFYPIYRLAFVYSFFMLMPAVVSMSIFSMDRILIICFILMFIYLCIMSYRGNREYWDALKNEFLVEEKSKDLEEISRVDGLTGLYNRRYFDEVFTFEWTRSMRTGQPVSIILADIDRFKEINDNFGHPAGDEYLKVLSRLFKRVFKRKIDLIARYGGEEFIVLMPGESVQNAAGLAEEMRTKIQLYLLEYEGMQIKTTLSLGVAACTPEQGQEQQRLISKADAALYQAKADGRNRVVVSS